MIDEFSKYKSRKDLVRDKYNLLGNSIVAKEKGDFKKGNNLKEKAIHLGLDLVRLEKTSESSDVLQESHLRFLSRCRLLNVGGYIINEFIGAGQCGAVYEGIHKKSNAKAAVKILFFPRNIEEKKRFINEGNKTYHLDHPNLVDGYQPTQKITGAPIYWYPMELLTDSTALYEYKQTNTLSDIFGKLSDVCTGLSALHDDGLVHRDLHMENIVVVDGETVKILDFGTLSMTNHDFTFRPAGSLKVCSPEKMTTPSTVGPPTDMFSVGCIAYNIVSGEWPLYGSNFGQKVQLLMECDPDPVQTENAALAQLVSDLLEKEPSARPTAREAASRFNKLATESRED